MDEMLADYKRRLIALERRLPAPPRAALSPAGQQVTDWNDAVNAGFYWGNANAANRPNVSWGNCIVQRNAMPGFERIVQDYCQPSGTRPTWRRVGYWEAGNPLAWSGWRRLDRIMTPTTGSGYVWDRLTGRLNVNNGSDSWWVRGIFTTEFRAYRILYNFYSDTPFQPRFRFTEQGGTQISSAYNWSANDFGGSGYGTGANDTNFVPSRINTNGHAGEIVVTEPMYTAGNKNQKRARGTDLVWPHGFTSWAGGLGNFDTVAMDGFVMWTGVPIAVGAESWISVEGIA